MESAHEYLNRLSDLQLDLKCMEHLSEKALLGEPELYQHKWWDYRLMHPGRATFLFAADYAHAYAHIMRSRVDFREHGPFNGMSSGNINLDPFLESPKKIKGFWKARRFADGLGIPYPFFVVHTLKASDSQDFEVLATPDQLCNRNLLEPMLESWLAVSKSVMFPKDPFYHADAWVGNVHQREWQRHILSYMEEHQHKIVMLAWILHHGMVVESLAREWLGDEIVDKAKLSAFGAG